jgi:outer membrane protein assembly factor BamB
LELAEGVLMRIFLTMTAALLAANCVLAEDHWPQFRGPQGNGRAESKRLPLEFGEGKNVKWKTEIHGKGWSSPVVWKNQIWLTTATEDGKKMSAVGVDAETGKVLHDILIFENAEPAYCHPTNSYASPTPVIEEGRLYVHFGTYGTAAVDTNTGEILWSRRDLNCDHFRGPASSPILHENALFFALDGIDIQYVAALDKHSGKTLWKKDRGIDYNTDNGDRKKAYSTAQVITVAGKPQIISPGAMETIAYDPANGDVIWRVRHGGMNAACRPIYEHGLVYISAGDGGDSLVAVRADGEGDVTQSHIVWKTGKTVPKRSSQVIVGELFFMVNDSGVVTCLDAKTGDFHWQKRLEGEYWASPFYANGRIYLLSKDGRAPVIAAEPEFELLADNSLESGFNASPAVVGNDLVLRTFTHLYRIGE